MSRLAVLALAVALGACTADVPETAPSGPGSTATQGVDLAALLFDEVPPGYEVVADETRALTLEEAVDGVDDPEAARKRLQEHGFVRGYSRSWSSNDDSANLIVAFVYEFRDEDGARADMQSGLDEAKADGDRFFDIPGVPGARGVEKEFDVSAEDALSYLAVFFVRGPRLYLVALGGAEKHEPEEVIELARKMNAQAA